MVPEWWRENRFVVSWQEDSGRQRYKGFADHEFATDFVVSLWSEGIEATVRDNEGDDFVYG